MPKRTIGWLTGSRSFSQGGSRLEAGCSKLVVVEEINSKSYLDSNENNWLAEASHFMHFELILDSFPYGRFLLPCFSRFKLRQAT